MKNYITIILLGLTLGFSSLFIFKIAYFNGMFLYLGDTPLSSSQIDALELSGANLTISGDKRESKTLIEITRFCEGSLCGSSTVLIPDSNLTHEDKIAFVQSSLLDTVLVYATGRPRYNPELIKSEINAAIDQSIQLFRWDNAQHMRDADKAI